MSPPTPRVLFLDDDPERAARFLAENPHAVWVQTVTECIAQLVEPWDEVHLDHDLGGEQFVDQARADCGMEVVRWLCLEPRPHLRRARFQVHSHNAAASMMMGMQLTANGFRVELRPFGAPPLPPLPGEWLTDSPSRLAALARWLRRLIQRVPAYGDRASRRGPNGVPPGDLDLGWTRADLCQGITPPEKTGPDPGSRDSSPTT